MLLTPNNGQAGTSVNVTLTDPNATWLTTPPQLTLSGGASASAQTPTVINDVTAVVTLATGLLAGPLSLIDNVTSDTAIFTVTGIAGETEQDDDAQPMMNFSYYGTMQEAEAYFAVRLHEHAWKYAEPADKPKALYAATTLIDALNFKGDRHTVWLIKQSMIHFNSLDPFLDYQAKKLLMEQMRQAEEQQPLEFPRGTDTVVPQPIRRACYEIAYSLLDGKDPEMELENLQATSHGYGEVRTHYERGQVPIEHIINMVPNAVAWNLLRPFLRDGDAVKLSRVQ